jgi:cytochrome c
LKVFPIEHRKAAQEVFRRGMEPAARAADSAEVQAVLMFGNYLGWDGAEGLLTPDVVWC